MKYRLTLNHKDIRLLKKQLRLFAKCQLLVLLTALLLTFNIRRKKTLEACLQICQFNFLALFGMNPL